MVSSCPPDECELDLFVRSFLLFSEAQQEASVSLYLVDDLGVFERYSPSFRRIIDELLGIVTVVEAIGKGQFRAMYDVVGRVRADMVVTIDPDMAGNLSDIPMMVRALEGGCDMVFAVRRYRGDVPFLRRLASSAFNKLIFGITNLRLTDINTPMVAFSGRISSILRDFPEEAGHPKFYFPYILGEKFCQVIVSVEAKNRKSSYSWPALVRLAWCQLQQAYAFSRFADLNGRRLKKKRIGR